MDLEALNQSGIVMLIGMVVIFLFLTLLIFVINFTAFIARKLKWGENDEEDSPEPPAAAPKDNSDEAVAAMAAATTHHTKA